jgi:hypothetical protein
MILKINNINMEHSREPTQEERERILYELGLQTNDDSEREEDKIYVSEEIKEEDKIYVSEETVTRRIGITQSKMIDKSIEDNVDEMSWAEKITEDGTKYYRWSIFTNSIKDEILALPEPGPNMSYLARKSYFQNNNRTYSCVYLHPDQESAFCEYQIYKIVTATQREFHPDDKTEYKFKYRTYGEMMDTFHDCMKYEKKALLC